MESKLKNKKIILGVTGSIAAYKAPLLVRELVKQGAEVKCVISPAAKEFVTPLVLENLSRNQVIVEMFDDKKQTEAAWHIQMSHWADLMIIAPCSATTLSKIANGLCDVALVTLAVALPRTTPLLISPAMDSTMYQHPSTQRNIAILKQYNVIIIPPASGDLASGLVGEGRMPDIPVLIDEIEKYIDVVSGSKQVNQDSVNSASENKIKNEADSKIQTQVKSYEDKLKEALNMPVNTIEDSYEKIQWQTDFDLGEMKKKQEVIEDKPINFKKVLITAGPTVEKIDDVRYISNFSSGKMGFALAQTAKSLGAEVILIAGPVELADIPFVTRINIQSAEEMYNQTVKAFEGCDIAILSAAVADFTPANPVQGKIKKQEQNDALNIELVKTKDILAALGKSKKSGQKLIGFALESINEIENGWKKLKDKNCDMLVVNSATKPNSGFGGDDNTITILTKDGKEESFPTMTKQKCSEIILKKITELK